MLTLVVVVVVGKRANHVSLKMKCLFIDKTIAFAECWIARGAITNTDD